MNSYLDGFSLNCSWLFLLHLIGHICHDCVFLLDFLDNWRILLDYWLAGNYLFDSLMYWLVWNCGNWLSRCLSHCFGHLAWVLLLEALRAEEVSVVRTVELLTVVAEHGIVLIIVGLHVCLMLLLDESLERNYLYYILCKIIWLKYNLIAGT